MVRCGHTLKLAASGAAQHAASEEGNVPRQVPLDREGIAAAALQLLDSAGVGALTMRGLAAAMGVRAPSLYNHVDGLDDVIDLVQELVNREIDHGALDHAELRPGLAQLARSYRAAFVAHPNVLPHVVRRVIQAPTAISLYDNMARFLLRHGVPQEDTLACMAMIDGVVLGSALDTFHAGFTLPTDYARQYPSLAVALEHGRTDDVDEQSFEEALTSVLDRIEARLTPRH